MLGFLKIVAFLAVLAYFAYNSIKKRSVGEGNRARSESFFHIPTAVTGAITAAILVVVLSSFGTLGAGERGVVTRLGAVTGRVLPPGLYTVAPLVEAVTPMDVRTQKEVQKASASSKDIQNVTTTVAVNFALDPSRVAKIYQEFGDDIRSRILDPAIQEAIKSTTAKYTSEELVTKRHIVKEALTAELMVRCAQKGLVLGTGDVSITDFDFDPAFKAAAEAKMTALQKAMQTENELRQARADSAKSVASAGAEATKIRIQAQAIQAQGGAEYVQMKWIEKWDGALPTWVTGSTGTTMMISPPSGKGK